MMTFNESTYKEKIHSLPVSGIYEILRKDPMSQVERKIWKLLTAVLKHKLAPYHSKPPQLCGLPKMHTPNIPLRPVVSFIHSPCYALAEFLNIIHSPLAGNTGCAKDSEHFRKSIQDINLQNGD
jgi:hypothetical protein